MDCLFVTAIFVIVLCFIELGVAIIRPSRCIESINFSIRRIVHFIEVSN